jgi:hypothetical protein
VSPEGQQREDQLFARREGYRLTFNLPDRLEEWITEREDQHASRIREVKSHSSPRSSSTAWKATTFRPTNSSTSPPTSVEIAIGADR